MLALAVATRAETFERIREPLRERDVAVRHLRTRERAIHLAEGRDADPPWTPDDIDVGFVYPPRLMEGGVADALLDVPWVNGRREVLTSRNKAEVLARLDRAGLPVPATTLVSNPIDREALLAAVADHAFPVVVKPNSTTRGVGVARADDLDTLLGIVDYLDLVHDFRATGDRSFLLQEFVPEATDYRAMVLDGEYAGAVERRLPDDAVAAGRWKHNVHRGAEATGVALPPEHRELVEAVARTLDIPWLGVDILVSGDRVVVGETNARPTVDAATKYEPGFYDDLAALVRRTAADG